jgi:hypothetical protein
MAELILRGSFYLDQNVLWCIHWILQCCQVQFFACYIGLLPCAERCTHGQSSVFSINNTTQEFVDNTIEEQAAARISENETTIF